MWVRKKKGNRRKKTTASLCDQRLFCIIQHALPDNKRTSDIDTYSQGRAKKKNSLLNTFSRPGPKADDNRENKASEKFFSRILQIFKEWESGKLRFTDELNLLALFMVMPTRAHQAREFVQHVLRHLFGKVAFVVCGYRK